MLVSTLDPKLIPSYVDTEVDNIIYELHLWVEEASEEGKPIPMEGVSDWEDDDDLMGEEDQENNGSNGKSTSAFPGDGLTQPDSTANKDTDPNPPPKDGSEAVVMKGTDPAVYQEHAVGGSWISRCTWVRTRWW
jgi:hypothetical protein